MFGFGSWRARLRSSRFPKFPPTPPPLAIRHSPLALQQIQRTLHRTEILACHAVALREGGSSHACRSPASSHPCAPSSADPSMQHPFESERRYIIIWYIGTPIPRPRQPTCRAIASRRRKVDTAFASAPFRRKTQSLQSVSRRPASQVYNKSAGLRSTRRTSSCVSTVGGCRCFLLRICAISPRSISSTSRHPLPQADGQDDS